MANAELSVQTGFPKLLRGFIQLRDQWVKPSPEQEAINRFPDVTEQTYINKWETSSINLVLNRERNESGF
jgi:hypothetical protein